MADYLQTYTIELKALGPVFVGSGKALSKKEYLFKGDANNPYSSIQVLDINKLYNFLTKKNLGTKFEDFMLNDRRDLRRWLNDNRINQREVNGLIRYELPCGDTSLERGTSAQIMECMKDPYGKPYIPGSSVKGMLRTILLSYVIDSKKSDYEYLKRKLKEESDREGYRNTFLNKETRDLEVKAFYTLNRQEGVNAVNDVLSGMIVSDSDPLEMKNVILCQKIERHVDGTSKSLNILRECIAPGTVIRVPLAIDTKICPFTETDLLDAVNHFIDVYNESFVSGFKGVAGVRDDRVFLGGGAGFVSKTVIYPLYGKKEGIEVAQNVFQATLPHKIASQHKHYKDSHYGASPHILKCTRYGGKLYQMGLCSIQFEKRV